jgi:hypothetical protein
MPALENFLQTSSPRQTAAILRAMQRYGPLGATLPVAALKHGEEPGLVDELGTLSFAELEGAQAGAP